MAKTDQPPIDTLRLAEADLRKILDQLDESQCVAQFESERRDPRIPFRTGQVVVTILESSGRLVAFTAYSRNISANGVAFILGVFVYPGNRANVTISLRNGERISANGIIARCRYLGGRAHEVAVVFESPVSLEAIERQDRSSKSRDLIQLTGHVLVVDDFEPDRNITRLFLERAGMTVEETDDPKRAREVVKQGGFDLVVLDQNLGSISGLTVATILRREGFAGPILMCSADESEDATVRATAAGCNGYLAKPIDQRQFISTVAGLLAGSQSKPLPAIHSAISTDSQSQPLIENFLETIQRTMDVLKRCVDTKLADELRVVCSQLKDAAATYGFPELSAEVKKPMDQLQQPTPSWDEIRHTVSNLINMMNRLSP